MTPETFKRRAYWLIKNPQYIIVHYLDEGLKQLTSLDSNSNNFNLNQVTLEGEKDDQDDPYFDSKDSLGQTPKSTTVASVSRR